MEAQFDSTCQACGSGIDQGEEIAQDDDYGWIHEDCAWSPQPAVFPTRRQVPDAMSATEGPHDVAAEARAVLDLEARARERREAAGYKAYETLTEGVRDRATRAYARSVTDDVVAGYGSIIGALSDEVGDPGTVVDPLPDAKPQPEYRSPDRWGRYVLPHPSKPSGRRVTLSRATTVNKATDDMTNLSDWHMANVALGLGRRPDLVARAAGMSPGDRGLKELVKAAQSAGGGDVAANLGTAMHTFTENVDWGRPLSDVPELYRTDVQAYLDTLRSERLTVIRAGIERITMTSRWDGIAGKLDRIYRLADGRYVIGDVKSGKVGYDPKSMYAQLATYAEGVNEVGVYDVAGDVWERLPFTVDTDIALIMHLPAGEGVCNVYVADLEAGRAHLDMCAAVRRHRKLKHKLIRYAAPERTEDDWRAAIRETSTRRDLGHVGRLMEAVDALTPELRSLAMAHREGLPD